MPGSASDAAITEVAAAELLESAAESVESAAESVESADLGVGYAFDNFMLFICAVLVLFMQAGFAMVEVGLNSAKNTVNILHKNVMDLVGRGVAVLRDRLRADVSRRCT